MKRPIAYLLGVAALLRLVGISYGLPMWFVGDEPSFIFGSFKMIELRTLIPALHDEAFRWTFYYPPFLSYLYLLPFTAVACVRYVFFSGTFAEFTQFLQTDLSHFFLAARLLSAAIGTATVYLVYRIGKNLFGRERDALFAAAFLAFSFLHVNFSHWARHWVPATCLFSLVIFFLSQQSWSAKKRYLMASFAAGVGMGVTQQVGLVTVCIALWFFLADRFSLRVLRAWWPWACVGIFLSLTGAAYLLWPPGFYVAAGAGDYIARTPKTIAGLLSGYEFYFLNLAKSEPVLLLWLAVGAWIGIQERRRFGAVCAIFGIIYVAAFYFLFLHVDRFLLMLYPLFALFAGHGLARFGGNRMAVGATCALLLFPVIRYDALLLKNDTRIQALQFIEKEIPAGAKVLVMAPLMRLSATAEAIDEQEAIDPASIRSIDRAERALSNAIFPGRRYHALNMYMVRNIDFLAQIREYMQSHGYAYVVYEPGLSEERAPGAFDMLGAPIVAFHGYDNSRSDSIVNGIGGGWGELLSARSIGPDIIIKRLTPDI